MKDIPKLNSCHIFSLFANYLLAIVPSDYLAADLIQIVDNFHRVFFIIWILELEKMGWSFDSVCRYVSFLVFYLFAGELRQWVMHWILAHDIDNFEVFFICAETPLSLLWVVEQISHLDNSPLLFSSGNRLLNEFPVLKGSLIANYAVCGFRSDGQVGDVADWRQSFSSESKTCNFL